MNRPLALWKALLVTATIITGGTALADVIGVQTAGVAILVVAGLNAEGLPLGLQVIGKHFDEETVFAVSAAIEQAAGFAALPEVRAK